MATVSLDQRLRLELSKGPDGVEVSFPSLEDGNRSNFRNVLFYTRTNLEFPTMDKIHKASDFECYTPSSENLNNYVFFRNVGIRLPGYTVPQPLRT
jgi:hypothetical protein